MQMNNAAVVEKLKHVWIVIKDCSDSFEASCSNFISRLNLISSYGLEFCERIVVSSYWRKWPTRRSSSLTC